MIVELEIAVYFLAVNAISLAVFLFLAGKLQAGGPGRRAFYPGPSRFRALA